MKIGIVGAGLTGLTAAYELSKAGHQVTVFEQAPQAGGLSSTFADERWEWPLDRFYRHLFRSDRAIIDLSREIGIGDQLVWPRPITAIWHEGTINAFDSPFAVLRYPYLSFLDKMRVGLVTLYLRLTTNWKPLERVTAHEWLPRYIGSRAYHLLWEPLLANKMGQYYQQVNMAWFWARIYKRSQRLGYYAGSYQTLIDALMQRAQSNGAVIHLGTAVTEVEAANNGVRVTAGEQDHSFDAALVTTSPKAMLKVARGLPEAYADQVRNLKHIGALTVVLALDRPMTQGFYWINLPHGAFPFLSFVEHTNFQSPQHYGGEHIIYLGDYPDVTQPHATASKEELLLEFLPHLTKFNPAFDPSWIRQSWLFREEYAQPVVPVNYSQQIPAPHTPVAGLYFACMSQVYPWDRGSNYAVEMGQRMARMIASDLGPSRDAKDGL